MRLPRRLLRYGAGVLALAAAFVVAGLLAGHTDLGRHTVERLVAEASGGTVIIRGLAGNLPGNLRIAHVEFRDHNGTWASADDVAVEWSPAALLARHLEISRLEVASVRVDRRPEPGTAPAATRGTSPIRCVDVAAATIGKLTLGAALAGSTSELTVHGHVTHGCGAAGAASIAVEQIGGAGRYSLSASADATGVTGRVAVAEASGGPLANVLGVPGLGATSLTATLEGTREAEHLRIAANAGAMQATLQGTIDLDTLAASLDVAASAPAMAVSPSVSWRSIDITGRWRGASGAPAATLHAAIAGLHAGGVDIGDASADLSGERGLLALRGHLAGLRLPAPFESLSGDDPVDVQARTDLNDAARPVRFRIVHPLLDVRGAVTTRHGISGSVDANAPTLRPLAAIAGFSLDGEAALRAVITSRDRAIDLNLDGSLTTRTDDSWPAALLGTGGRLRLAATLERDTITIEHADLSAQKFSVSVGGSEREGSVDARWSVDLPDLHAVSPALGGRATASGHVGGAWPLLTATAEAAGDVTIRGSAPGHLTVAAHADGLPLRAAGSVAVRADLDGYPLRLDANVERRSDGRLAAAIGRVAWRSNSLDADVALAPGTDGLRGQVRLRLPDLTDFSSLLGRVLAGSVDGTLTVAPDRELAAVTLRASNARYDELQCDQLSVGGHIERLAGDALLALSVDAEHASAGGIAGDVHLVADGPARRPHLRLDSAFRVGANDGRLSASGNVDPQSDTVELESLSARFAQRSLALTAPARIVFADGVTVDRLQLGAGPTSITVAGRLLPALDVTGSISGVPPALVGFVSTVELDGTINGDFAFVGPLAAVHGSAHLSAEGIRVAAGPGRRLPPVHGHATAIMDGIGARIEAEARAGTTFSVAVHGLVPLARDAPLDLRVAGDADLGIIGGFFEAGGRRLRGHLLADATIGGTRIDPRPSGTIRIEHGDLQDFALGVHLTDVAGTFQSDGGTIRVGPVIGHAGSGIISVGGTIGLDDPALPVDLTISGHGARMLTSDLITATTDLDLALRGKARGQVAITGRVHVTRADITIPGAFPPDVVVLDVRRPGASVPPQRRSPFADLRLNLSIDASSAVFLRGRGLDAELAGELHATGTVEDPLVGGAFDLRDGTFNLGGAPLRFTSGRITLNGRGIRKGFDPTLDFVATSVAPGITATVTIGGYADAPSIVLSSVPEAPQDEILSRILFGQGVTQLTTLQVAQIGAALASISGLGGSGMNPVSALQRTLGLDRLSFSSSTGTTSTGTSIEAGRYASSRVFVGARQSTTGGTQALVQIDLTRHLKLQTALGAGSNVAQGATPENDPGNTIGLSYQIEY